MSEVVDMRAWKGCQKAVDEETNAIPRRSVLFCETCEQPIVCRFDRENLSRTGDLICIYCDRQFGEWIVHQ